MDSIKKGRLKNDLFLSNAVSYCTMNFLVNSFLPSFTFTK